MANEQERSRAQAESSLGGILRRIATGVVQPRAGLRELVTTYRALPQQEDSKFVGEEYGIAQLIGYFYSYDDLEERPAEVAFDGHYGAQAVISLNEDVMRLAKAWLDARGA